MKRAMSGLIEPTFSITRSPAWPSTRSMISHPLLYRSVSSMSPPVGCAYQGGNRNTQVLGSDPITCVFAKPAGRRRYETGTPALRPIIRVAADEVERPDSHLALVDASEARALHQRRVTAHVAVGEVPGEERRPALGDHEVHDDHPASVPEHPPHLVESPALL